MKLVKSILTKNPCYTAGRTIAVKGLMLHSIGCPQPSASVFVKNWNSASYDRACVHGFIDANDGTVYQTLPWNSRGWHAGGGANNTHIGVEMCEPNCITYTGGSSFTCSDKAKAQAMAKRTYASAVELFAMLCKKYNLDPMADGVVISHREGHARGIASNHGDPEHLWRGLGLSYTMNTFRSDVKKAMNGTTVVTPETPAPTGGMYHVRKTWADSKSQIGAYKILANAKAKADENPGYNVYDSAGKCVYTKATTPKNKSFTVRVKIKNLNIRKGPGYKTYARVGYCPVGTYTIVETKVAEGYTWGRLKSGIGWIALEYTERV